MNKIAFVILFLMSIVTAVALDNTRTFINFNVDNGLASNEVYKTLEDHKGTMWFATDKGVCYYNGYEFKTINSSNGLPDNTVFGFIEDHRHRIWLRTFSGRLAYIKNDSVTNVLPGVEFGTMMSIYVDKQDTIWVSSTRHQFKIYPTQDNNYAYDTLDTYYFFKRIDDSLYGNIIGSKLFKSDIYYNIAGKDIEFYPQTNDKLNLYFSNTFAYNVSEEESWIWYWGKNSICKKRYCRSFISVSV